MKRTFKIKNSKDQIKANLISVGIINFDIKEFSKGTYIITYDDPQYKPITVPKEIRTLKGI